MQISKLFCIEKFKMNEIMLEKSEIKPLRKQTYHCCRKRLGV